MVRSNLIIAGALSAFIAGCAHNPAQPLQVRLPDVSVPEPQPVSTQDYTYKVYRQNDIKALAATFKKHPNREFVIFAITPDGYQRMSNNYVELERYISEQKEIIVYLKRTITERSEPAPQPEAK